MQSGRGAAPAAAAARRGTKRAQCQAARTEAPPLTATGKPVSVGRFMGSWYVVAHIPVRLVNEHLAHNAIETYAFNRQQRHIDVHYRFNEQAMDGPVRNIFQRLWTDGRSGAEWRVSPQLPLFGYALSSLGLKFPYLIAHLEDDYSAAIVGYPSREYLWILSRTAALPEERYAELLSIATELGYDADLIRSVPQDPDSKAFLVPSE